MALLQGPVTDHAFAPDNLASHPPRSIEACRNVRLGDGVVPAARHRPTNGGRPGCVPAVGRAGAERWEVVVRGQAGCRTAQGRRTAT